MTAAFWANIFYAEMNLVYSKAIPLAATDSHNIYVNPPAMQALGWDVEHVAFVNAHEVLHYTLADLIQSEGWKELGHVIIDNHGGTLPYDHQLMNAAMDYRINAILIDGKIGKMPKQGLYDPKISAIGMESCVEIYAKLYKQAIFNPQPAPGGFDEHLEPSQEDIDEEASGIGEAKRGMAIAAAIQAAEAAGMGDLPAGLKRLVGEILEPKVRWQEHLKAQMQRAAGEPNHNWSQPNKRLISRPKGQRVFFARRSKYGCGTVVVGWDTSGSTFACQDTFFAEMAGIVADLNPAELIVIRCDAAIHGVDNLEQPEDLNDFRSQVNAEGIGGGGGTRFEPVFDHIREHHLEPDMLVYLTDTYGSFPKDEPSYPVIWATIGGTHVPWGHVVEIKE